MYVILDGYDLGIGIMSIFFDDKEKDTMLSVILPVWDGNGTWLVLGGASLYGAFPLAFSVLLPTLYFPMIIMVVALLFRGIALEFRLKASGSKKYWNLSFFFGSLIATICQGVILGAFIKGFGSDVISNSISSAWLTPFSIITSIGLIIGYSLLGINRVLDKTQGQIQLKCFDLSTLLQYIFAIILILVTIVSPMVDSSLKLFWYASSYTLYLSFLPALTVVFLISHIVALKKRRDKMPFWLAIGIFLTCFAGLVASSFPYIVPKQITYLDAAAPTSSLLFITIGAALLLPVLLAYSWYSYHVFRGKIHEPIAY
jgi:cytochrome d ubiquinol oxidase subunit II